jgi:hypothetical protein
MPSRSEVTRTFVKPVTNPAPGAEISITPTGMGFWRILSFLFTFATSAVVANRFPSVLATDGTTRYWRSGTVASLAASQSADWAGFPGVGAGGSANGVVYLAWPNGGLILPPGFRLATLTTGLDAGDQYSGIAMLIEELLTGEGSTIDVPSFEYSAAIPPR